MQYVSNNWILRLAFLLSVTAGADPCNLRLEVPAVSQAEVTQISKNIVGKAKKNNVPVFLKKTENGDVPVVLMNNDANAGMKEYLERSIGTQIYLQPNWNNDHGGYRLGKFLIDVDTPGARGFGEVHDTGLSWKSLDQYLKRRGDGNSTIIEVSYGLTNEEYNIADYYQKVRRAAIFRVPFTFGGNEIDEAARNLLKEGGEHCFVFCKASAITSHLEEIESKIFELSKKRIETLQKNKELQKFLEKTRETMSKIAVDPRDENQLWPDMFFDKSEKELFEALKIKLPTIEKRKELLNWLIAYDATERYVFLIDRLGVTSSLGAEDIKNQRVTAVLIYDSPKKRTEFENASYKAKGKFYNWASDAQSVVK